MHIHRAAVALYGGAALLAGAASAAAEDPLGACGAAATRVHAVQGTGRSSPVAGRTVVVEGVGVGDFRDPEGGLGGFFLQEEDGHADGDPRSSEGIFVFDPAGAVPVRRGERARVRGEVREFFGLTELGRVSDARRCRGRRRASPVRLALPVDDPADWERWEGMAVRVPGPLVATGSRDLGRFGELDLATRRLFAPTHLADPGAAALRVAAENARRRILLDDGRRGVPPHPPHLSRDGTLRLGDEARNLEGVVDFAFGRHRIQPTRAPRFRRREPRPERPPPVAGELRVASANLQNFMNGDGRGGGFPTRGARTAEELELQTAKLVEMLARLEADVLALTELENDGAGPRSALRELAEALSARTPESPWAAVDPGPRARGHAIAVGLLYRPAAVAALGPAAVLDAGADAGFDDTRNRPSLAQTFESLAHAERFTVVVSHFKSRGSSCAAAGDPDRGDGQGDCNGTRSRAARALARWLARDPTGSGDPDVLLLGDLNAHPREDPLRELEAVGFVDLLAWFGRAHQHSFVFAGQAGRLDHALASPSLLAQATGAAVWHVNADEAELLGYRDAAATGSPGSGPFRASDHDPLRVGLFATRADGARCPTPAGPGRAGSSRRPGPRLEGDGVLPERLPRARVDPGTSPPVFGLERGDVGLAPARESDLVEALEERLPPHGVHVERDLAPARCRDHLALEVDGEEPSLPRLGGERSDLPHREHDGQNRVLEAVLEEDVAEARCHDAAVAEGLHRPHGGLARAAAAEVLSREQQRRVAVLGAVQHAVPPQRPALVVAQRFEGVALEVASAQRDEPAHRDDDVRVHVAQQQRRRPPLDADQTLHGYPSSRRTSVMQPATAAAAAIAGPTRWVRAPGPWRPTKLRFDVETQRWPGGTNSPFDAEHTEQPGSRHAKPASRKIRSRPSASAARRTEPDPGTTQAVTWGATLRPRATAAAERRSESRALLHDPTKTRSMRSPSSGRPGTRSM
jgi:predicted extracellular nuclease